MSESETWICKICKNSNIKLNNQKRKLPDSQSPPSEIFNKKINTGYNHSSSIMTQGEKIDKILNNVNEIKITQEDLKSTILDMKNHQLFLSNQLDDLELKLINIVKENDKIKSEFNTFKKTQNEQQILINNLEADIDIYKQNQLENNVIIGGLPNNIDINEALQKIMFTLNTECKINDVAGTKLLYSSKNKQNQNSYQTKNSSPLLLVQFKSITAKTNLVNKKKEKKSLFFNEIGFNSSADRQIYIRDHVTKFKMDLFNECRELRQMFNLKYLWMSGSKILIRKAEESKVYEVNNRNDINKLKLLLAEHNELQSQSIQSQSINKNKNQNVNTRMSGIN